MKRYRKYGLNLIKRLFSKQFYKQLLLKLITVYRSMSIKKKLPLIFAIQIILPLLVIGTISYKTSESIISNKSINYSQDILTAINARLQDFINNISIITQDLLYEKNIYNILSGDEKEHNPLGQYENDIQVNNVLRRIIFSRSEIDSISLSLNSGKRYISSGNSRDSLARATILYDTLRETAKSGRGKVVWYLDCKDKISQNIYLTRMIYGLDGKTELGLLIISIKKDSFSSFYQGLITKDVQNIEIISSNEEIINSKTQKAESYDNQLLSQLYGKKGAFYDRQTNSIITYISMIQPDWIILTSISEKKLFREIEFIRHVIILLSIVLVLLLSVFSYFIANDLILPIDKMVHAIEVIHNDGEITKVQIDRDDELGFLNKSFNKMADKINYLVKWVYREQITRKEAEIKALQAQINPHFLFNTLEAINWMARLNHVTEISDMVTALSSLMEANIGRDSKFITFREELAYIDNYIFILKTRHEGRFELIKNIAEDVLNIKIPKLLIQPLIENAFYHGIENIGQAGLIELSAHLKDHFLYVSVYDNGNGISEENLHRLQQKLALSNNSYFNNLTHEENKKNSIGLDNVNRRIKLFSGESYGLEVTSVEGEFTKVSFCIPAYQDEKISMSPLTQAFTE